MPRRIKSSPFSFGQATLEPIKHPLWCTRTLPYKIPKDTELDFFRGIPSKTYSQSRYVQAGGQLYAPQLAVVYGVWAGIQPLYPRDDWDAQARATWQRIRVSSMVRFQVGVKVPMHLMPVSIASRRIAIPCQQQFFVCVTFTDDVVAKDYTMTVALNTELGIEVR